MADGGGQATPRTRGEANERNVHCKTPAAIGASALHVVLAILIGRLDRQDRRAIATVD